MQFFAPGARPRLEHHLISTGLKIHDLVSRREVEELVAGMYQTPTASNGYAVSQLLTLSAWLERYA